MTSGLSGLLAGALSAGYRSYQNTAQNEVNAENPDYSKTVATHSTMYMSENLVGVQAGKTIRCTDPLLRNSLMACKSELEQLRVVSESYTLFQGLMGQVGQESETLAGIIGDFLHLLQTPNTQESVVYLNELAQKAHELASAFRSLSDKVQNMRCNVDQEIFLSVRRVQELLCEYDSLNKDETKVSNDSARFYAVQDRKDAILLELSTYLEVHQTVDVSANGADSNMHYLWGPDGLALVTKKGANTLEFQPTRSVSADTTYEGGGLSGITLHFDELKDDITKQLTEGKLGGLLQMRDSDLPGIQAVLDRGASLFADTLNGVHNQGTSYALVNKLESGRVLNPLQQFPDKTGVLRVAILDSQGVVTDKRDILIEVSDALPLILDGMRQIDGVVAHFREGRLCVSVSDDANGAKRGIALCGLTDDAKDVLSELGLNDLFWGNKVHTLFSDDVPTGFAEKIELNPRILESPETFAHGMLNDQQHLSIDETGMQRADNRTLNALAEKQEETWTFKEAGPWQERSLKPFDYGRQFMTDIAQRASFAERAFQAKESGKNIINEAFFKVKGVDEMENRLEQMKWSNYLQNVMTLLSLSQSLERSLISVLRG